MMKYPLPFPLPPPAFDDFVEGENREALIAVQALADGKSLTPAVYVWGRAGSGKTHLLQATVARARRGGRHAFFISDGPMPPPMPGLLAVDNIEQMNTAAHLQLFDWLNHLKTDNNYAALGSGSAPPLALQDSLGEELATRWSAGLVFQLRELSENEKCRALGRYAERRGFALPDVVVALLMTRLPRDMTSLISALASLDEFLLAQQKPLTLSQARQWLQQWLATPTLFAYE